jgi:hypothetical protein
MAVDHQRVIVSLAIRLNADTIARSVFRLEGCDCPGSARTEAAHYLR